MINHVRTLLLNRAGGSGVAYDFPGEEYVPPTFKPKALPGYLSTALSHVFGNKPDRLFRNYRMRQLMQLVHSTELEEHVLDFDSRITYDLTSTAFFDAVFKLTINQYAGPPTALYGTGEHVADDGAGHSQQHWLLTVLDATTLQVQRLTPPASITNITFTQQDNLSEEITLSGSSLKIRFQTPAIGVSWEVFSRARPGSNLGAMLANVEGSLGTDGVNRLLTDSASEPFKTYRNLWNQNDVFAYKYGALLLAMAHTINVLPQV